MKKLLFPALILLLFACKSERTVFTKEVAVAMKDRNFEHPTLKMADEGYYKFGYCTYEMIRCNAQVSWFKACEDEVEVATAGLIFVDSIRALFFTNPDDRESIDLSSPGKSSKVGIYYWEPNTLAADGTPVNQPVLVIRIKNPRSDAESKQFSDLYFTKEKDTLTLLKLTYFDDRNSLVNLLPRNTRKPDIKEVSALPNNTNEHDIQTISAQNILAFNRMDYRFFPRPIPVVLSGDSVEKISYSYDEEMQYYVRKTKLASETVVEFLDSNPKSVLKSSWRSW